MFSEYHLLTQPMGLLTYGHLRLKTPSQYLEEWSSNDNRLIQGMIWLMDYHKGVALAANQVDLPHNFFIMRCPDVKVIINPRIVSHEDEGYQRGLEGCLSFPGLSHLMIRPISIRVEYVSYPDLTYRQEIMTGINARIFCHELDHLNGKLMIDHMTEEERNEFIRKYRSAV
jgi:peptide deformylase